MIIFSTCCNSYKILLKLIYVLKNHSLLIFNRDLDGLGINSNLIKIFNFNKDISSCNIKNNIIDNSIKRNYEIIGFLEGNIIPSHNSFDKMLDYLKDNDLDCVFYNKLGLRYSVIKTSVFDKIRFPNFYPFNYTQNGIENDIFIELLNYYGFKHKEFDYFECYYEKQDLDDMFIYFLQKSSFYFIKKLIENNIFDYSYFKNKKIKCYINKDLLFYFDIICPWINFIGKKLKSNYNENVLIDIISSDNNEIIDKNLENFYNFIFDNLLKLNFNKI
jgi:hypothetical protein